LSNLAHHLLGKNRAALLAALLLRPDERLHVRELARSTGTSPGTLHRELKAFTELGLVTRREIGRQVFYAANRDCPIYPDLAGLLRKTVGLVDLLRQALQKNSRKIRAVFVYGSMAAGEETVHSDVDVMILGDVSFADAVRALAPAQTELRREVNATVMKVGDFIRKRKTRDGFVTAVWKAPKLWVIGSEDELGKPGQDGST
jgi:DNA-binding transcriptional ArsR family regulator